MLRSRRQAAMEGPAGPVDGRMGATRRRRACVAGAYVSVVTGNGGAGARSRMASIALRAQAAVITCDAVGTGNGLEAGAASWVADRGELTIALRSTCLQRSSYTAAPKTGRRTGASVVHVARGAVGSTGARCVSRVVPDRSGYRERRRRIVAAELEVARRARSAPLDRRTRSRRPRSCRCSSNSTSDRTGSASAQMSSPSCSRARHRSLGRAPRRVVARRSPSSTHRWLGTRSSPTDPTPEGPGIC